MQQSYDEQAYTEARRILRSLLLGHDPESHGRLSVECVVMQPDVKTALALGVEALQTTQWVRRWREKKRADPKTRSAVAKAQRTGPANQEKLSSRAGESWSSQEDRQIIREFSAGEQIGTMARNHSRSQGAILARLVHLGLAPSRSEARVSLRRV